MTIIRPATFGNREVFAAAMVIGATTLAAWQIRVEAHAFFPGGLLRLAVSLVAIAVVYGARRQTLVKRALYVLAVEAAGGIAAFVLVDVPLVQKHSVEIGNAAIAVYERIGQTAR